MVYSSKKRFPLWSSIFAGGLVLVALCFAAWHWYLAIDKENVLDKWQDSRQQVVTFEEALKTLSLPYNEQIEDKTFDYLLQTPIQLEGMRLADWSWLLETRLENDMAGYDVLFPIAPEGVTSESVVLVNTGWVASSYASLGKHPQINTSVSDLLHWKIKIVQIALTNSQAGNVLLNSSSNGQFLHIQQVQTAINALSAHYRQVYYGILLPVENETLNQVLVEREKYTEAGFLYHFQPLVEGPELDQAYAIQWLLLAVVIAVAFQFASFQKSH